MNCYVDLATRDLFLSACERKDLNIVKRNGWYPLTWAVDRGLADILETILSVPQPRLDLSVTDRRGRNIGQISVESTARYSTVQYSTVQYITLQYSLVQYSTVQ